MSKNIIILLAGRRQQDSAHDQPDESRNLVVISVTIEADDNDCDWTKVSLPTNRKNHFERQLRWNTQNLK